MAVQFCRGQSHAQHVRHTRREWLRNIFCLRIVLFSHGSLYLVPRARNQRYELPLVDGNWPANSTLGLSLEDMNDLFSHYNVRARFIPSRLTTIEGMEGLKVNAENKETAKSIAD